MKGPFNWKVVMYCPTCMKKVRVRKESDDCPECGTEDLKSELEVMTNPNIPLYFFKNNNH